MESKIINKIRNNWMQFVIIIQPILDVLAYFELKFRGVSHTWVIRFFILAAIGVISFIKSENRKRLIKYIAPFMLFLIVHLVNLYRINQLNVIMDIKYFILTFQMPILSILLIDYIKSTNYEVNKIKKSICYSFFIIAVSVLISYITKTYDSTYIGIGITGWFSSANTQSMILCAVAPWTLYYLSNNKNLFIYILGAASVCILLYANATRACYITLVASFVVMLFSILMQKNEKFRVYKLIVTMLFICIIIFSYQNSLTFNKEQIAYQVNKENEEDIKIVIATKQEGKESVDIEKIDIDKINFQQIDLNDEKMISDILKTSYIYRNIMEIHGDDKIVEIMKNYLSPESLSNNRLCKFINAKIEFDEADMATKLLGIGYSRIQRNELDMENDMQAIFFYYGYLGFAIYISFIGFFLIKLAIEFIKNFSIIRDKEYIILAFLIILLIGGGEYSGAFLRKSNANIYLSLYLVLLNVKLTEECRKNINNKKISFLLLHLGYGGIESSVINAANELSKNYEIELISFYNLKNNQSKYVNKDIKVKYLYNGGPNKDEFEQALKQKNIFKMLKEGIKSIDILLKKKYLIKREIVKSESYAIVSTRYDFSILLNKYGSKDIIKIAQEHHHHNNDKKYINILKHKYKNIDYLCALTEGLKKEYEMFLKFNKHTKIIVMPNMIDNNCKEMSDLKNKNIISISRLHEGKRLNELIEIFSKLQDKQVKLYIIGDGEEQKSLEKQIKGLKLENRVFMLGYLNKEQQLEYLLKSSVYAMTSISEGLPMVLLEAMNFGIPCIAYKTDTGVADIIKNNKNGFIIENRNQEEYIKKLEMLLEDTKLKENMRKECKNTSKKYYKEEIVKIWESILKK